MTLDGFNRLEEELKRLKTVERPEIIKAIALAREHGDLSENAEYHAAKERQSFNEGSFLSGIGALIIKKGSGVCVIILPFISEISDILIP